MHTALETWETLFYEGKSKKADVDDMGFKLANRCIAYYDSLNPIQKTDVELVVARYFNLFVKGKGIKWAYKNWFKGIGIGIIKICCMLKNDCY